jgi:hypothetical protein
MFTFVESLHRVVLATTLGLLVMAAPPAQAGTLTYPDATVVGVWSSPVLTGDDLTIDPNTGVHSSQHYNNTATAVYSISLDGSTLQWGAGSSPPPTASVLTFVGKTYPLLPLNTPLTELGTLTYTNGASDPNSLIFGALLTLSIPKFSTITPLPADLVITSTSNFGLNPNNDADFFYFSNVSLDRIGFIFEGQTTTFTLYGNIVGDPVIQLTDLVLAPGQTGGFVGVAAPEPGSLCLFGGGLAILTLLNRLRKNRVEED